MVTGAPRQSQIWEKTLYMLSVVKMRRKRAEKIQEIIKNYSAGLQLDNCSFKPWRYRACTLKRNFMFLLPKHVFECYFCSENSKH